VPDNLQGRKSTRTDGALHRLRAKGVPSLLLAPELFISFRRPTGPQGHLRSSILLRTKKFKPATGGPIARVVVFARDGVVVGRHKFKDLG
jgi:hypothetical protein